MVGHLSIALLLLEILQILVDEFVNPRALSYTVDSDLGEGRGLSRTAQRLYSLARSFVRFGGGNFFALVSFRFATT